MAASLHNSDWSPRGRDERPSAFDLAPRLPVALLVWVRLATSAVRRAVSMRELDTLTLAALSRRRKTVENLQVVGRGLAGGCLRGASQEADNRGLTRTIWLANFLLHLTGKIMNLIDLRERLNDRSWTWSQEFRTIANEVRTASQAGAKRAGKVIEVVREAERCLLDLQ